jgi:hypothetical protein
MAVYWAGPNLVVNLYSPEYAAMEPPYAIYLDTASKRMTPIFTFDAYKSVADFANASAGGQPTSAPIPLAGAGIPTPDGSQYLFVHRTDPDSSNIEVASIALPPDGSAPTSVAATRFNPSPAARANTISSNGKTALIFDYLLTLGG